MGSVANHLKMADRQRIHALLELGWSDRRIAREAGVDRETVARYARAGLSNPANLIVGEKPSTSNELSANPRKAASLPPLRIFQHDDGNLYSLDNRRLVALQQAGVMARFQWATPEEIASESWKVTTPTNGLSVQLRIPGLGMAPPQALIEAAHG